MSPQVRADRKSIWLAIPHLGARPRGRSVCVGSLDSTTAISRGSIAEFNRPRADPVAARDTFLPRRFQFTMRSPATATTPSTSSAIDETVRVRAALDLHVLRQREGEHVAGSIVQAHMRAAVELIDAGGAVQCQHTRAGHFPFALTHAEVGRISTSTRKRSCRRTQGSVRREAEARRNAKGATIDGHDALNATPGNPDGLRGEECARASRL